MMLSKTLGMGIETFATNARQLFREPVSESLNLDLDTTQRSDLHVTNMVRQTGGEQLFLFEVCRCTYIDVLPHFLMVLKE